MEPLLSSSLTTTSYIISKTRLTRGISARDNETWHNESTNTTRETQVNAAYSQTQNSTHVRKARGCNQISNVRSADYRTDEASHMLFAYPHGTE